MPAPSGSTALLLAPLPALPAAAAEPVTVGIGYLALAPRRVAPQVTLDPPPTDEGVQGCQRRFDCPQIRRSNFPRLVALASAGAAGRLRRWRAL